MAFPLQPYDFLMIAVIFFCALFGAWKGMAWQLAALASVVLSGLVAIHGSAPLAPYFGAQSPWNRCVAMLLLYVGTSLVVWLAFNLVSGFVVRLRLKEFDRQLGGVFGAVKGVLWCVVITFFAVTLSEPARQAVLKSYSGYYIAVLTERARPILPQEVRAVLGKYIDELDRELDPKSARPPASRRSADGPRG
jgi:membrane protein required for colicin V production